MDYSDIFSSLSSEPQAQGTEQLLRQLLQKMEALSVKVTSLEESTTKRLDSLQGQLTEVHNWVISQQNAPPYTETAEESVLRNRASAAAAPKADVKKKKTGLF